MAYSFSFLKVLKRSSRTLKKYSASMPSHWLIVASQLISVAVAFFLVPQGKSPILSWLIFIVNQVGSFTCSIFSKIFKSLLIFYTLLFLKIAFFFTFIRYIHQFLVDSAVVSKRSSGTVFRRKLCKHNSSYSVLFGIYFVVCDSLFYTVTHQ